MGYRVSRAGLAALICTGLTVGGGAAVAQDVGQQLYMSNCAVCHGADGKGAGAFAEFLTVAPPALTTLAADNDGEFPMREVIYVIDGRSGVRGHGGDMPVWGDRFVATMAETGGDYSDEVRVRGLILSLAQYLEEIQE